MTFVSECVLTLVSGSVFIYSQASTDILFSDLVGRSLEQERSVTNLCEALPVRGGHTSVSAPVADFRRVLFVLKSRGCNEAARTRGFCCRSRLRPCVNSLGAHTQWPPGGRQAGTKMSE